MNGRSDPLQFRSPALPPGGVEAAPTPAEPPVFPSGVRWERDYWLGRCTGYRVDTADGTIGRVESLRFESRTDRPDFLVVRAGMLRPRRADVKVDDVAEIDPRERRIRLR